MPYFLSPIGNDQQVDTNGNPLSGGKINTYLAGTSTPATTYTSNLGTVAQANPIVLNALGRPSSPIWMTGDVALKFVITNSSDTVQFTVDNVVGLNDPQEAFTEWVATGLTPSYVNATTFTVTGNQTTELQANRRIQYTLNSGVFYGHIFSASFGAGITTIIIVPDATNLDATMSSFKYGFISATNTSIPQQYIIDAADAVPDPGGHAGEFLGNDGTTAAWTRPETTSRTSNTIFGLLDMGKKIKFTSAFTQTFTAAATLRDGWSIKLFNASTGAIILQANGAETFAAPSGARNTVYMYPGESFEVTCDGTGFYFIGRETNPVLERQTVSGVNMDLEAGFADTELNAIEIEFDATPSSGFLAARVRKSGAWQSGSTYGYALLPSGGGATVTSNSDTMLRIAYPSGTAAQGIAFINKPSASTKQYIQIASGSPNFGFAADAYAAIGGGSQSTVDPITGLRLLGSGGALTSGTAISRGRRG